VCALSVSFSLKLSQRLESSGRSARKPNFSRAVFMIPKTTPQLRAHLRSKEGQKRLHQAIRSASDSPLLLARSSISPYSSFSRDARASYALPADGTTTRLNKLVEATPSSSLSASARVRRSSKKPFARQSSVKELKDDGATIRSRQRGEGRS
jgi:hypothetical protein